MNRRGFIASVAAATAAEMLLGTPLAKALGANRRRSVLVIGAGMAGLSSADILLRAGYSVRVLEAGPRIGGKLFGGLVDGHVYDFGGQAFSKDMMRVRNLGRRFGLTEIARPAQNGFYVEGDRLLTDAPFDAIDEGRDGVVQKSIALYPEVDDDAKRKAYNRMSVMDWARTQMPEASFSCFRSLFEAEWCDTPERVSMLHYLEASRAYEGDVGEMDFRFREGMCGLVKALAREVGSAVRLNSPVQKIEQRGNRVFVSAGQREYDADAVIVAIPMPQLKNVKISGLDLGALPGVLKTFESAAVRKILVSYRKPFWRDLPREGEFSDPCGLSMMDNSDMEAGRYSLALFLGGSAARSRLGREDILKKVAKVLGPEALEPTGYHDQSWLGSEYLAGGYASNRIVAETGHEFLPTSLGRMFLAGSETATVHPTYIEGALSSAERATRALMDSLA